jgi:predicted DNA-binding antitoxin AbrB/MazE fold protein
MVLTIRAVYHEGQLRLLDPVDLPEGQQVKISIETMTEEEALRAALGDSVRWPDTSDDSDAWVEELADEIDRAFQGDPPLSQIIIEDRGEL